MCRWCRGLVSNATVAAADAAFYTSSLLGGARRRRQQPVPRRSTSSKRRTARRKPGREESVRAALLLQVRTLLKQNVGKGFGALSQVSSLVCRASVVLAFLLRGRCVNGDNGPWRRRRWQSFSCLLEAKYVLHATDRERREGERHSIGELEAI